MSEMSERQRRAWLAQLRRLYDAATLRRWSQDAEAGRLRVKPGQVRRWRDTLDRIQEPEDDGPGYLARWFDPAVQSSLQQPAQTRTSRA